MGVYEVFLDSDDLDWISVAFEGGFLFSSESEEDCYSVDEVPDQVRTLTYKHVSEVPGIRGFAAEYALKLVFPSLPDPEGIFTDDDKSDFVKAVIGQLR